WLYAMPWQPLAVAAAGRPGGTPGTAQPLDTHQLSLGYTGPQIFPVTPAPAAAAAATVAQSQPRRRPILLGLLTPHPAQGQFTLPFRPSPFAGYSVDKHEEEQHQQQQHQQQQHQQQQHHQHHQQLQHLPEPGFYAPGYPEQAAVGNPTEEPSDEQQIGEDQQQQHFIYMSPGTLYNLVSN
ncbi:hypothetical protein KR044_000526, partial [Drosophila immigrans]